MNLFEKIFNYEMMKRLDESGSYALTSQERTWLKMMLPHEAAGHAFAPDTLDKLAALLQHESAPDIQAVIMEKAKSREEHVYHPLLRVIRRIIVEGKAVRLSYGLKHGGANNGEQGLPIKLEYNMAKREWYLLWYRSRYRSLMSTKLRNIVAVEVADISAEASLSAARRIEQLLDKRKEHAVIGVMPRYNEELSRILYAFSCFEKTVDYDEEAVCYRIRVSYLSDESEFLLSRIRFLGLRVKVLEGDALKRRMRESATKALGRYGIEPVRDGMTGTTGKIRTTKEP